MPHHGGGFLGQIEDEIVQIEQMALGGGLGGLGGARQQPGMVQQQPMGYGQGMYGAYGPPAGTVQYVQPLQAVQPLQPAYAMRPAYGAMPAPAMYGQAYVEAPPAMQFGGAYEGAPTAYRGAVNQAPQQGYAQALQPAYGQGYPQPSYGQAPPPPQQYGGAPQQAPQYAPQPQTSQYAPQYGAQQAPQQAPPPAPQYGAPPTPQQAPPPAPQYAAAQAPPPAPQYGPGSQQAQPQYAQAPQSAAQNPPSSQPGGQPTGQQGVQYPQTELPIQAPAQATSQYPPASQRSPQPQYASQYPPQSQPSPQPQYTPQTSPQPQYAPAQPPPQPDYGQPPAFAQPTGPQRNLAPTVLGVAAGGAAVGAAALGYVAYERHHQAPHEAQVPVSLSPQDTNVLFEPVSLKHGIGTTHHHFMKAISHSNHSVTELSAIIGTSLLPKYWERDAVYGMVSARPEVKEYYQKMDKLEKLSADYVTHHKSSLHHWKTAMGPHRRAVFADLYNRNELVRAFCQEMQGGPLAIPELDSYSLGTKLTNFSFARSAVRQANTRASVSLLAQVRTVILVDDSYSMTEPGHSSWGFGRDESRWMQTRGLLAGIAPLVAAQAPHGMDMHFLNRIPFYAGLRTTQAVQQAFDSDRPNNGTPTGARVNDILDAYVSTLRYYRALMPLNLIVITDGEAQDESLLHLSIEHHVTELVHRGFPAHQFGVEFVQVGDCEHATRHLERLEKEVSRHHHRFQRDVVGVTPANRISNMDPQAMLAIAVSGVDARVNGYMRSRGVNV